MQQRGTKSNCPREKSISGIYISFISTCSWILIQHGIYMEPFILLLIRAQSVHNNCCKIINRLILKEINSSIGYNSIIYTKCYFQLAPILLDLTLGLCLVCAVCLTIVMSNKNLWWNWIYSLHHVDLRLFPACVSIDAIPNGHLQTHTFAHNTALTYIKNLIKDCVWFSRCHISLTPYISIVVLGWRVKQVSAASIY